MSSSPSEDKKNIVKLAHLYFQSGQWDKALAEYRKILLIDPEDMNTHNTLGDIYVKKNIMQAAYEAYNKAATGFLARNQVDKAFPVFKKLVKLDASKLTVEVRTKILFLHNYIKADDFMKDDQISAAVEVLGKILKVKPQDPVVEAKLVELEEKVSQTHTTVAQYQALGDVFLKNDIFNKAEEMFKKIAKLDPKDLAVRSNLAQLYAKQGSENEAKKEYLSIAEQLLADGKLEMALDFAKKATALKSVEASFIIGMVFFKRQKWAEAKIEFEKLLRIKLNHSGALLHLALVFDALNEVDKATENFHRVLKVDADDEQVQEAWVEFCFKRKEKETAIPNLTVLIDKAMADNNAERAVKFSKMMIALAPEMSFPHSKLAQLLKTAEDFPGAVDACCVLAMACEKKKLYKDAINYLERALELSPENAELLEKALADMRYKASPPPAPVQAAPVAAPVAAPAARPPMPAAKPVAQVVPPAPVASSVQASMPVAPPVEERTVAEVKPVEPPKVVEEVKLVAKVPEPVEVTNIFKFEPQPIFDEGPSPVTAERHASAGFATELAIAELCVKQGLLKAAIDVYQQILEEDPSLVEVRNRLNDVNAVYLKKWMDSSVLDSSEQASPFLPFVL